MCGPNGSTTRHSSFNINQIGSVNSAVLILPIRQARSHLPMQLPRSLLNHTPKQRRTIPQPQQPLQSHPRHHWPSMFRLLLVSVAILVILGRLCMTGSFTLRPSRLQPQQQRHPPWVQEQKLFFLRRTWNHYHYDYLVLPAMLFLMLMLIMWMLPFKLMQLCCFRQADNHAAKLHLHRHRTTRSTKGVTSHESLQI